MVIEEPDIDRPLIKLIAFFEKLVLMGSRFYSASSLSDMIERQGLAARIAYKDKYRLWLTVDK
jgi:demethylmenaquinone methyltransferase/2-methoxy-6-polyprenyl-1,4-benzoquinol methylase